MATFLSAKIGMRIKVTNRHGQISALRAGFDNRICIVMPETSGVSVIIFTAREHVRGHQKSTEMGAADYFRKPFEPDELIELVEKHVGQQV